MIIKNKISIFFCFTDDSVEIFSFILLCHKERVKKAVSTLQLYGKMSLTNYITQSVVGTVIYFPFVFYLAPYCGYAASYLIEFTLFGSQIWLCKWWLTKHNKVSWNVFGIMFININQERINKFNRGCPKRKKFLQSLFYRYLQRG